MFGFIVLTHSLFLTFLMKKQKRKSTMYKRKVGSGRGDLFVGHPPSTECSLLLVFLRRAKGEGFLLSVFYADVAWHAAPRVGGFFSSGHSPR